MFLAFQIIKRVTPLAKAKIEKHPDKKFEKCKWNSNGWKKEKNQKGWQDTSYYGSENLKDDGRILIDSEKGEEPFLCL